MTVRRKTGLIAAGVAAILIVALIFAVPALVNLDRYRPEVISYFEENTGKKVEIGRLVLTFFPVTIHIENFGVKSPPLFPPSYIVKVVRADAVLDFWALLHRKVVIRSLVLQDPEINLVSDPDGPWNFQNPETTNSRNTFPLGIIDKVVINRGQLMASNLLEPSDAPGPTFFEAHNISSELDMVNLAAIVNPTSPSLNGQGSWKASRLRFGAVETTNVNSKFRLESREVFFTNVRADA